MTDRAVRVVLYPTGTAAAPMEDTMNITLPPDLEQFVQERIASGRAGSPDHVIAEALALLREQEMDDAERLAALRADIDDGLASLTRGDASPTRSSSHNCMADWPHKTRFEC